MVCTPQCVDMLAKCGAVKGRKTAGGSSRHAGANGGWSAYLFETHDGARPPASSDRLGSRQPPVAWYAPCICSNGFLDSLNSPPAQVQAIYKDALLALSKDVDRSR